MNNTIKTIFLLSLGLSSFASMASSIRLGSAINRVQNESTSQYTITKVIATAHAKVSERNPKFLGQWEKCYKRTLNVPPSPFQKYIYTPFQISHDASLSFETDNFTKEIVVNENEIHDLLTDLQNKLEEQTEGKCKLDNPKVAIEFKVKIGEASIQLLPSLFLEKKKESLIVSFGQWKEDMSGIKVIEEEIPNTTLYDISYPY